MRKVSFKNRNLSIAGNLHLPPSFDESKKYPALVLSTPGSSVKEQIGFVYASRMAEKGFVSITFDPAYQGESEGEPRDLEDPWVRAEDIRCALDFLTTQSFVDEKRIGLLGICAGGGYAVHAALTEHRFAALGTVVANDIGSTFRKMLQANGVEKFIKVLGQQRTLEARGAALRRDPWIPDSLDEAHKQGVKDPELLEAIQFYRESEYRHPNSTNRLLFRSYAHILSFDAFHLVPELLTMPLQVIVGGRKGNTGQFEAGHKLLSLAPNQDKHLSVVEGAGHYDLYYKKEYVDQAIATLSEFFLERLVAT